MPVSLGDEVVKAIPTFLFSMVSIGVVWLVGKRLTVFWNVKQKARELALEARKEFHFLYGDFFAIWKLWRYTVYEKNDLPDFADRRWKLLERISSTEGRVEAIVTEIAAARRLSDSDIASLGRFRQHYQGLRSAIRDSVPLKWRGGDDPGYLDFKRRAAEVSVILAQSRLSTELATTAFQSITSPRWQFQEQENADAPSKEQTAENIAGERQAEND
jgi:hypothetical protein